MSTEPQDDLAYIRQVMEQTRRYTRLSGNHLIVWGLLVSIGLACDGYGVLSGTRLPLGEIWLALIALGWGYSFWNGRREARRAPVTGYAAHVVGRLWIACGAAMTTTFLVGGWTGAVDGAASGGLCALFIGLGVFMTGVLGGMAWFRNLAFGWWAGAIGMFVWHGTAAIWLSLALLIGLLVIPGIALNLQARRSGDAAR